MRTARTIAALPALIVAASAGLGWDSASAAPSGGSALAAPPRSSTPSFLDGGLRVTAERLGPKAVDAAGRALTPVRLRYPSGRTAKAAVGRTAILKLDPGAEHRLVELGVARVRPLMPSIGLWLVTDAGSGDGLDVAERLGNEEAHRLGIREAIPDLYIELKKYGEPFTPNDPRLSGQWYFDDLKMKEAWAITKGDPNITIVVIDSGCDLDHPDLASKMDPGRDVLDNDDDPTYNPSEQGAGHGTACAGIVAAATNNGEGIAGGCPECRLRCVRLIDDMPNPLSYTVEAFQFALEVNAAVVSNSWGPRDAVPAPSVYVEAINNVFDNGRNGKGALVLFAAGNDDREIGDDELLAVRGVLGIGAITHFEENTSFTNRGNSVDLVAPTGTLTTDIVGSEGDDPGDYTSNFGGTSSACPVAAGIAGLLASVAPDRSAGELYDVLIRSARPAPYATPDENGHDLTYGYGIIDPVKALQAIVGEAPVPEPAPEPAPDPEPPKNSADGTTDDAESCACAAVGARAHRRGAIVAASAAVACMLRRRRPRRRAQAKRPG